MKKIIEKIKNYKQKRTYKKIIKELKRPLNTIPSQILNNDSWIGRRVNFMIKGEINHSTGVVISEQLDYGSDIKSYIINLIIVIENDKNNSVVKLSRASCSLVDSKNFKILSKTSLNIVNDINNYCNDNCIIDRCSSCYLKIYKNE